MLEKLKKKLLEIAGRCDYADACPYFDEDSYYCTETPYKQHCGKWRQFARKSDLQVIKDIIKNE